LAQIITGGIHHPAAIPIGNVASFKLAPQFALPSGGCTS